MHILEIEILSDNIEQTTKFYSELLGFKILQSDRNKISFSIGKSILTFFKSENIKPQYHFAFNIPCNKIEDAILWTSSKVPLIKMTHDKCIVHFDSWNANAIYFYDNNGNILEFIARRDLNNASETNFNLSSIESISEIGIVAENALELADQLIHENKLSFFEKGAKSESFCALGDDTGLFVIVKKNRNWYPTDVSAKPFFTGIFLEINNEKIYLSMNEHHTES